MNNGRSYDLSFPFDLPEFSSNFHKPDIVCHLMSWAWCIITLLMERKPELTEESNIRKNVTSDAEIGKRIALRMIPAAPELVLHKLWVIYFLSTTTWVSWTLPANLDAVKLRGTENGWRGQQREEDQRAKLPSLGKVQGSSNQSMDAL